MSPREVEISTVLSRPSSSQSLQSLMTNDKNLDETESKEVGAQIRAVSFGSVIIREYSRVLSDHPDVKVGPPIGLGWDFLQHGALPLDEYEQNRPERRKILRLSSITRKNLLVNVFGYSEEEVRAAEKEIQIIRKLREQSSKQSRASRVVESALQAARRKLRRRLSADAFLQGLAVASGFMMPFHYPM